MRGLLRSTLSALFAAVIVAQILVPSVSADTANSTQQPFVHLIYPCDNDGCIAFYFTTTDSASTNYTYDQSSGENDLTFHRAGGYITNGAQYPCPFAYYGPSLNYAIGSSQLGVDGSTWVKDSTVCNPSDTCGSFHSNDELLMNGTPESATAGVGVTGGESCSPLLFSDTLSPYSFP
ncbi:MAG: hypothetical protein ACRDIY_22575 [Chloroflexota bacterium]